MRTDQLGGGRLSGLGLTLWLLLAAAAARAEVVCEARVNRTSVPAGGELVLTVSTEGDVGWSVDFQLPDLPGVRVYTGGTNQSMSMVNGQTRSSVTRTWYLRVEQEGTLDIGPVLVLAKGESCSTGPLRVTVTAPQADAPPPADTGNRTPPPAAAPPTEPGTVGGDIFVTLDVDKPEAWLGEQVILTFRYWRRVQPWNNPSYTPPRTEGFWREDLGPERTLREVRGGRVYSVTEIRYALFPTRAGQLVIEPAELTFPEDVFDRFFNSRRRSQGPRVLRTERLVVDVRPLPVPAPAGFSGLVANRLQLTAEVSPDTVAAGDPVELKLALEADGFLKGFAGLDVRAAEGARMHDAAESYVTGIQGDRLQGRLGVEKVLVPDRQGELVVPATHLTWFDAGAGRYVTSSTPQHRVQVTPGILPAGGEESSGFLRSEIARVGADLAFIHAVPRHLRVRGEQFFGSFAWWILLALPPLLLAGWRLALVRLAAQRRDPAGRRRRRALGTARRVLDQAGADPAQVARAVCGYVADCTDRPAAAVSSPEVEAYAADRGCAGTGRGLADLLRACDAARFGGASADAGALATEAMRLLQELEGAAPRAGAGPAAVVLLAWALAAAALPAGAQRAGTDPARPLAEGNQAYTEGDLDLALARYTESRAAGADDAVLHYNLGNTHARRGELGLAVASYLRAQRLDPRDPDLRANLAWVRSQIRDLELTSDELPLFIRQFAGLMGRFTLDEWAAALLVALWGLAAIVAWGWFRDEFGDNLRRAGLAAAALLAVTASVTVWRWQAEMVVDTAVVVAGEAAVRSGPAETFPVLFMVHDGLAVRLDGTRPDWVRISLGGDWQGWLPREAVVRVRADGAGEGDQGR